jgi:hypothetical protein
MGIEPDQEKEGQMVGVPEGLKTLIAYLVVSGRVHQEHQKQHKMARNAAGLRVVDLKSCHWPDL